MPGAALPLLVESLDLRGHDEVAFGQAVDLVGPEQYLHLTPANVQVRVVPLLLGDQRQRVDEINRLDEVFELERPGEPLLLVELPAENLTEQRADLFRSKRRCPPAAGDTGSV